MPRPRDKRAAIVRAALELMSERSYEATPVPAVAARAGVATGTLYRYFESKEALGNAVYRECKLALQRFLADASSGATDPREGFHRLWRGLWDFARKQPAAVRFLEMQGHASYLDAASRDVSRAVFEGVADWVRRSQRAGAIRDAAPELLIALAFGAFVGLLREGDCGHVALDEAQIEAAEEAVWDLLEA